MTRYQEGVAAVAQIMDMLDIWNQQIEDLSSSGTRSHCMKSFSGTSVSEKYLTIPHEASLKRRSQNVPQFGLRTAQSPSDKHSQSKRSNILTASFENQQKLEYKLSSAPVCRRQEFDSGLRGSVGMGAAELRTVFNQVSGNELSKDRTVGLLLNTVKPTYFSSTEASTCASSPASLNPSSSKIVTDTSEASRTPDSAVLQSNAPQDTYSYAALSSKSNVAFKSSPIRYFVVENYDHLAALHSTPESCVITGDIEPHLMNTGSGSSKSPLKVVSDAAGAQKLLQVRGTRSYSLRRQCRAPGSSCDDSSSQAGCRPKRRASLRIQEVVRAVAELDKPAVDNDYLVNECNVDTII